MRFDPLGMPVQADFPELLDNDSDEEDTDFKISSDDDSYISLESSESIKSTYSGQAELDENRTI